MVGTVALVPQAGTTTGNQGNKLNLANKVRFVTATTLFDGHDASINIFRRILQASGAEVVHLGHSRSGLDIVEAAIDETRTGFEKAGVSLDAVKVLKGGKGSSKIVMGAYKREVGRVGHTGLTEVESFIEAKGNESIAEKVEATLRHEIRGHKAAHQKAIARGVDGQIQQALGEDVAEAIDEANAMKQEGKSNPLQNKPREYAEFDQQTTVIARELQMSRGKIIKLFAEGREDEIAQAKIDQDLEKQKLAA